MSEYILILKTATGKLIEQIRFTPEELDYIQIEERILEAVETNEQDEYLNHNEDY